LVLRLRRIRVIIEKEKIMELQEKLDKLRADFEAKAPKDALEIMHRVTDDLRNSGIMQGVLINGETAPDFELKNADENPISLKGLLTSGPVVLSFYRGRW
jgi:hypothetical protein